MSNLNKPLFAHQVAELLALTNPLGGMAPCNYGSPAKYHNSFWDGESMLYGPLYLEDQDGDDDEELTDEEYGWFLAMHQRNDAEIEAARYPEPEDRIMARYDEAGTGNLPSNQELEDRGIDRAALARSLRDGMTASKFTRALSHGLNVEGFNSRMPGQEMSMETLLDNFLHQARARSRTVRPENRSLALHGVTV